MTTRAGSRGRAVLAACAVLTRLHHVYGAIHHATPWRYHAVHLSVVTLVVIPRRVPAHPDAVADHRGPSGRLGALERELARARSVDRRLRGPLQPRREDALYWGGLPDAPTYEMPNDRFFDITGILQVRPAAMAARELVPPWKTP